MLCEGDTANANLIGVKGYYRVPKHPDYGWRTELLRSESNFRFVMYNVSPEGEEEIAMEMDFGRSG